MAGIITGVEDLYFSKVTKDDKTGVTYAVPVEIAKAINIKISPNMSSATLYANNVAVATANAMGTVEVELEIDQLSKETINLLLGVETNADGVLAYDGKMNAPYGALLFRSPLSTGEYRYVALTKGMFSLPEDTYSTASDKLEFQTKTIKGTFVTRESDKVWKYEVDSDDATNQTIVDNWFAAVYAPSAS